MGASCSKTKQEETDEDLRNWARRVKNAELRRNAERESGDVISESRSPPIERGRRVGSSHRVLPDRRDDQIAVAARRLAEVQSQSSSSNDYRLAPLLRPREKTETSSSSSSAAPSNISDLPDLMNRNDQPQSLSNASPQPSRRRGGSKQGTVGGEGTPPPPSAAHETANCSRCSSTTKAPNPPAAICILPSFSPSPSGSAAVRNSNDSQSIVLLASSRSSATGGNGSTTSRSLGTSMSGSVTATGRSTESRWGSTSNNKAPTRPLDDGLFSLVLDGVGLDE